MLNFSKIFGVGQHPLVGLDIGSSSIKMVELVGQDGDIRVQRYSIESLPAGTLLEDGTISNREAVIAAISSCWKRLNTTTKNVAVALPASFVISKRVLIPASLSDRDMESQIEIEASKHIPFSIEDVFLDFSVLGPSEASVDDVEVQITAAKKDRMAERASCVEEAGLKVVVVDVETFATQRSVSTIFEAMSGLSDNSVVAHIDIGATNMKMVVYKGGYSVYNREQSFGGNQLTQDISREFSLSFDDAEAKKRSGDLPENYKDEVLHPFLNSMAQEISRSLQFFFTSTQFGTVDQVVLSGGCSTLPEACETVHDRLQVPVEVCNPFRQMSLINSDISRNLIWDAPSLMVACGLGLRRFDKL